MKTTPEANDNTGNASLDTNNEVVLESTESLLTGQGNGEDDGTPAEVEAAMLAGWNRSGASRKPDIEEDPDAGKKPDAQVDNGEGGEPAHKKQEAKVDAEPEDLDVPGLGMKASEVKARLGRLDTLEKTMASTNGHLGHLKSLIQTAGKGKAITKESLTKVREEFGDDYAEALAADLTAAGIGGGASVDEEALSRIVSERVAVERDTMLQAVEKRMVRKAHSDAADYFVGGKHNAEFLQFVGTLPKERQEELANTWDSDVIIPVLDEFKASKAKVEEDKTKQTRRLERSVLPTASRGAAVSAPSEDPLEAGWNSVRGRGRGHRASVRT